MVSGDILQDKKLDQNDVLFEELPIRPVKRQIIKPNARFELAANKIRKKNYNRQGNRKNLKKDKCYGCEMVQKIRLPRP